MQINLELIKENLAQACLINSDDCWHTSYTHDVTWLVTEVERLRAQATQPQRDLEVERRANARLRDQRRDLFAGMAQTGMLAREDVNPDKAAAWSREHADALIAELDKEGGADGV